MIFKNPMDAKTFTLKVFDMVDSTGINYMDAIMKVATDNNINEERLPSLITPSLKEKLRVIAEDMNMLKRSRKLPV
jgi:hypothetical protein